MDRSDLASVTANTGSDGRVFLYEVVFLTQKGQPKLSKRSSYPRSRVFFRVPYSRMTQEMQRITHQGGKIIRIIPLSSETRETLHPNLHLPWWVEITTTEPRCVYFFGPFESEQEAEIFKPGYLEDLEGEGAQGLSCWIEQCQPQILTQEF